MTNSLNLNQDPLRHNGVVIWVPGHFPGTSCTFVISWQWYYDWWVCREEQWGNLDLHMFRPTLHNRPKASNFDTSVAKAVTCKWLHGGAGTSKLTWPRRRKSGTAPRRTSSSVESETSGHLRSHTPSRRTTGPVEKARTGLSLRRALFYIQTSISPPPPSKIQKYRIFTYPGFNILWCCFFYQTHFEEPLKRSIMGILYLWVSFLF